MAITIACIAGAFETDKKSPIVLTTAATPTQAEGKLRKNSAPAPEENEEKNQRKKKK
jgi:hypothetical protein